MLHAIFRPVFTKVFTKVFFKDVYTDSLLTEDGFHLLQEDGSLILL